MNDPADLSTFGEPALFGLVKGRDATQAQRRAAIDARLLFWCQGDLVSTNTGSGVLATLRGRWGPSALTRVLAAQGEPSGAATSAGVARAGLELAQRDADAPDPEAS